MNTYRYFVDGKTVKSLNNVPYVIPHHATLIDELAVANAENEDGCSCVTFHAGKYTAQTDVAFAVGEAVANRITHCVMRYETKDDFGTTVNFTILEN